MPTSSIRQPLAYIPVIVARRFLAPATLLVLAASGSSRAAHASDQFPIEETSFPYTIGYTPIDPPRRGEFRRVQVRVRRRDVRVHARPGYVG